MLEPVALFPGSFDPFTLGHLDILAKASRLFGNVVVAVGVHSQKSPLFAFEERRRLIEAASAERGIDPSPLVVAFDGLVIHAARTHRARVLVRGIRDGSDLDYEMQMAGMNGIMAADIETVFIPACPSMRPITATLVRQIARMGGDVSAFVPQAVEKALRDKFTR